MEKKPKRNTLRSTQQLRLAGTSHSTPNITLVHYTLNEAFHLIPDICPLVVLLLFPGESPGGMCASDCLNIKTNVNVTTSKILSCCNHFEFSVQTQPKEAKSPETIIHSQSIIVLLRPFIAINLPVARLGT